MKLTGIELSYVRNKTEFEKNLHAHYKELYPYDDNTAKSFPWIVLYLLKGNSEGEIGNCKFTLEPEADFSNMYKGPNVEGNITVESGNKALKINADKCTEITFSVTGDLNYEKLPSKLTATVVDEKGNIFIAKFEMPDLSDKEKAGKEIEKLAEGGAFNPEIGKIISDLVNKSAGGENASEKINKLVEGGALNPDIAKIITDLAKKTKVDDKTLEKINKLAEGGVNSDLCKIVYELASSSQAAG